MKIQIDSARNFPQRQRGSYLLEALIAILIFSFGVLGLIGLLGSSIRITNDARYRSEAANLANAMAAEMWTMCAKTVVQPCDKTAVQAEMQLDTQFGDSGPRLGYWQSKAEALLPSAAAYPLTVDLAQPVLSNESRTVVITVFWKMPGETEKHQHMMTAQIGKNRG